MKYVYMLQSETELKRHYVGATFDLRKRLREHNEGKSLHTKKFMPWKLVGYIAFSDNEKADKFETYLKSASGPGIRQETFLTKF